MVENTRGVDGLEAEVFVVKVTDEQALGCEGIGLNVDICASDAAQETRLADIGVAADQQSACVGVNGRETTQMLADLVEVQQRILEALADGGHSTKSSLLELLALEERLAVLEEADVIS